MLSNDSTRFRKACIFTTQKTLRENTCPIASGDYSTPVSQRMKCRRCGLVPGKAMEDEKQRQAQQAFHDQELQPLLDEAKQGKRSVLFVDAGHFVRGAFLVMVWCFTRLLLPSASGRKGHNVLGTYDPITHEAITVTNDTYINQWGFCEFLDKIADADAGTGRPITLVLDNARYQKMPVCC